MTIGGGPGGAWRSGIRPGAVPGGSATDARRSLARLVGRLRPERRPLLAALVLGVAAVAANVSGPWILGRATNVLFDGIISARLPLGLTRSQAVALLRAHGRGQIAQMLSTMPLTPGVGVDLPRLGSTLALAAVAYLVGSALTYGQGYLMAGVAQRSMYRLRRDVEEKLARLPLAYFDTHPHGDVLSRVTNDIDNLTTTLQQGLSQLLTSVLTIIGVLAMMLWISPLLAAIAVVTIPVAFVLTILIARRSQVHFTTQWRRTGELNAIVEESHTGHSLVQVFGRRSATSAQFDEVNGRLYRASFRAQFLSGAIQPTMQFVSNLNFVAIAVIGGYRVASGLLSLGDVTAFIQYTRQFTMPITQIAGQMNTLQSGLASAERVFEFLDAGEEAADLAPRPARPGSGALSLRAVSFRYDPDVALIEDLSLEVAPGETVAIVGPTGAGKTTLVNLLVRFYEIDGGQILLDGHDYRELGRDEVRRHFAMVLQDPWLFAGSVRENIAYGRPGATEEEIVAAAQAAHVDAFVRTMPDGYDTVLGDDSANLSAGQRQLLTIARAFLTDPDVLILDEATSSVDTRTEVLIQRAMAALREGRTSFVIAHRLSTIRDAHIIVVMERGRVVEQGDHSSLLAAGGAYHRLYAAQFAGSAAEPSV